jgi:phosphoribosylamine--glycine ligase
MRFGEPTNHLQNEIHLSHWADLLYASAKGEKYILNHKNGYSVVVCIVIPPFPYRMNTDNYLKDVEILFKDKLTEEEWKMINFEEVKFDNETKNYRVAGHEGYILYITGTGDTVESARKKAYHLIKKIVLPKMMYRTDIGLKFIKRDRRLLEKWGWIKK